MGLQRVDVNKMTQDGVGHARKIYHVIRGLGLPAHSPGRGGGLEIELNLLVSDPVYHGYTKSPKHCGH